MDLTRKRFQGCSIPHLCPTVSICGLRTFFLGFLILFLSFPARSNEPVTDFKTKIQPILSEYCSDCHADGVKKGGIAFDELKSDQDVLNHDLWLKVLKNTRAELMPPLKKPRPTPEQQQALERWIKYEAFGLDPRSPDPGRVTIRRLNRVEYRNTVRDLLGVDFRTDIEFPPDDTGYGFDNIGDVLSLSPLLLEKYIEAAKKIVGEVVPDHSTYVSHPKRRQIDEPPVLASFFKSEIPSDKAGKRRYARELLTDFATRAFRRPVDDATVDRLVKVAENYSAQPGKTFEGGVAHAMVAVMSSPRFLYRLEQPASASSKGGEPSEIDEFSLASRLSYFLWSTMPDFDLLQLARAGQLRAQLPAEVTRMVEDPRSEALVKNFTGQWLQTRDVPGKGVNERVILVRDRGGEKEMERLRKELHALRDLADTLPAEARQTNELARQELKARYKRLIDVEFDLGEPLRHAMQLETELCVSNVVHQDRSITELIEADYTYLNEKLATFYGLTNLGVQGEEMRRVALPPDSPRGGVLTDAGVLLVTSNPDRTSPVKRGLFVLENILNTPTPPPPPNVPALELAEKKFTDREPTLREALEEHRSKPLCASCHSRMDPIGFGFENFNAMGMWRDHERNQTIQAGGTLVTGENFKSVSELKHILVTRRKTDFYRCLTEKLLTYALGRGLEYYDVETTDRIVERLGKEDGRFSALLMGIVESAPFQRQRAKPLMATK